MCESSFEFNDEQNYVENIWVQPMMCRNVRDHIDVTNVMEYITFHCILNQHVRISKKVKKMFRRMEYNILLTTAIIKVKNADRAHEELLAL